MYMFYVYFRMRTVLLTKFRFIHLDNEGTVGRKVRHLPPLFLLYVLLLSGCGLVDEDTTDCLPSAPSDSAATAVTFTIPGESGETRTAEGTQDLVSLQTDGFGVFACHHGIHPYVSSDVKPDFMYNQLVTWETSWRTWDYEPVKYWPAGDGTEENGEYVTFYAYAPYTSTLQGCVTDFSRPTEAGDPWLVYQLGGTREDWQTSQVDLLWAFTKDRQKGKDPSVRVPFYFRHALATAGDKVTLASTDILASRLRSFVSGEVEEAKLVVGCLTLTYTLLKKGRLVLSGESEPNWQFVASDDPTVERVFCPVDAGSHPGGLTVAGANASGSWVEDVTSVENLGIFYIPLQVTAHRQTVEVTAEYNVVTTATDGTVATPFSGSVSRLITLDAVAGCSQDIRLILSDTLPLE